MKPSNTQPKELHTDNGAENSIIVISNLILVIGIIASLLCAFTLTYTEGIEYDDSLNIKTVKVFNPSGLVVTILIFLLSLIQWAFLRVIANISLNIKEINKKLK